MLILKIVALGPIHGYAIAQRIKQISKDVLHVQQGSLYPALPDWRNGDCFKPSGERQTADVMRNSTGSREPDENN
jgi:DNA-binding PadR family transcriptional regulator